MRTLFEEWKPSITRLRIAPENYNKFSTDLWNVFNDCTALLYTSAILFPFFFIFQLLLLLFFFSSSFIITITFCRELKVIENCMCVFVYYTDNKRAHGTSCKLRYFKNANLKKCVKNKDKIVCLLCGHCESMCAKGYEVEHHIRKSQWVYIQYLQQKKINWTI